jgi:hypothetical protein
MFCLTDHQKELEKATQQREHADGESPQTFASITSTFLHRPFFRVVTSLKLSAALEA